MKIVAALNRVADHLETNARATEKAEEQKARREKATIFLLFCALGASVLGDVIYYKTLEATRRAALLSHQDAKKTLTDSESAARDVAVGAAVANQRQDRIVAANERLTTATIKNADLANRAWLHPNIRAVRKIRDGLYAVDFGVTNEGKTPAFDVTRAFAVDITRPNRTWAQATPNTLCGGAPKGANEVLYPTEPGGVTTYTAYAKSDGKTPLILRSCLVYQTVGARHFSEVCEYTDVAVPDDGPPKPLEQADIRFCPEGNRAD